MSEVVGTPYYVAPEVLRGKYTNKCDIWSIGVLFYIMLSGYLPFNGPTWEDVYEKILNSNYSLEQKEFSKVSDKAKDLLSHLLEKDYRKRYSATQALKHPWFK